MGSHFYDRIDYKGVAFSIELVSPNSNQHQFSPKVYDNFFYFIYGRVWISVWRICIWISRLNKVTNFAQSTLLPVLIILLTDGTELYSTLKKLVHFTKILEYLVVLNLNKVSQLFAHLYLTLYFKYV